MTSVSATDLQNAAQLLVALSERYFTFIMVTTLTIHGHGNVIEYNWLRRTKTNNKDDRNKELINK